MIDHIFSFQLSVFSFVLSEANNDWLFADKSYNKVQMAILPFGVKQPCCFCINTVNALQNKKGKDKVKLVYSGFIYPVKSLFSIYPVKSHLYLTGISQGSELTSKAKLLVIVNIQSSIVNIQSQRGVIGNARLFAAVIGTIRQRTCVYRIVTTLLTRMRIGTTIMGSGRSILYYMYYSNPLLIRIED